MLYTASLDYFILNNDLQVDAKSIENKTNDRPVVARINLITELAASKQVFHNATTLPINWHSIRKGLR